ncbi:MAG: ATP-binding protein [Alphaproteobacteria bacterium]|nr:ATP-binding protein [Alphaproteobacteria bacterium]
MLVEFRVANYGSIRDEQVLSMVATKAKEHLDTNTFESGAKGVPRLLRSVLIYGPNASGKSTLVSALQFMKGFVLDSSTKMREGDRIDLVPFLLDPASAAKPSTFEVTIVVEGVRYQYGFSADQRRVHAEWLLAFPEGRPRQLLRRDFDSEKEEDWEIRLRGKKSDWKVQTKSNSLFLSTAVQLNSEQLRPIYNWFRESIGTIFHLHPNFTTRQCFEDNAMNASVLSMMASADISIDEIKTHKRPFSKDVLTKTLPDAIKEYFIGEYDGKEMIEVKFGHRGADGSKVFFDPMSESVGTRVLFDLAGPWLDSLSKGITVVVDEINNSLHPHVVHMLVGMFHNAEINKSNAQLIATTHETSLMSREFIRRDQIVLVEKDENSATRVYALSDFSPRKQESIENGYLQGRYGAVPIIGRPEPPHG